MTTRTSISVTVKGAPALIERMVIRGEPYLVTNPGMYPVGKYRAEIAAELGTVTIREEAS